MARSSELEYYDLQATGGNGSWENQVSSSTWPPFPPLPGNTHIRGTHGRLVRDLRRLDPVDYHLQQLLVPLPCIGEVVAAVGADEGPGLRAPERRGGRMRRRDGREEEEGERQARREPRGGGHPGVSRLSLSLLYLPVDFCPEGSAVGESGLRRISPVSDAGARGLTTMPGEGSTGALTAMVTRPLPRCKSFRFRPVDGHGPPLSPRASD